MTECVVCGTHTLNVRVRLGRATLAACPRCDSWTYSPRPDQEAQAVIHDSDAYFAHPYFELRRTITPAMRERCRDTFIRLGRAIPLDALRGQRMLDVGCDAGTFLRCAAQEFGIVPVGIDVANRPVQAARESGVDAYHTTIEHAPAELRDFRVATAIDVVEHVPDPVGFLEAVRYRMLPGGIVYLETPNIRSAVYRIGARLTRVLLGRPAVVWERLFPAQHLQYFTRDSLSAVARRAHFEVCELGTRPLKWSDLATSLAVRTGTTAMQAVDRLTREHILLCAVLRNPE